MAVKTDNHNLSAKLELRRYFLRKYHTCGPPIDVEPPTGCWMDGPLKVLDCCMGAGTLWQQLREEFAVAEYLGVDLKEKKGRLKIDSVRVLDQPGWSYNVIDVDTYGSPWAHWFALLRHAGGRPLTVFLTIGLVRVGGISTRPDTETMRALDLLDLEQRVKQRGVPAPQSVFGKVRDRIGMDACLAGVGAFGYQLAELIEAENDGGNARYLGARLVR